MFSVVVLMYLKWQQYDENRQQLTTMANIRITYGAFRKIQMLKTHSRPSDSESPEMEPGCVCLFVLTFFFCKLLWSAQPTLTSALKNCDVFVLFLVIRSTVCEGLSYAGGFAYIIANPSSNA